MSGEFYAIACAFFWALSSTLLKSQTRRVEVISLAAWRTVPGVLIYVSLLFLSGRASDVLHLSPRSAALVVGSTFLGLGLGDLLYLGSMKHIGLARAMPLSATYPFFTDSPAGCPLACWGEESGLIVAMNPWLRNARRRVQLRHERPETKPTRGL